MTAPKFKEKILLFKVRYNKDSEAFGELYDFYIDSIYRYVFFKINSKEEAEDITSEVFLKIWNYLISKDEERIASFRPFIYKVARNTVTDYYRKARIREDYFAEEGILENIPDNQKGIFDKLAIRNEIAEIEQAMKNLKSEYREAITLRYIEELNISEISSVIGKSKGATRTLLHRATNTLKELLENEQRN